MAKLFASTGEEIDYILSKGVRKERGFEDMRYIDDITKTLRKKGIYVIKNDALGLHESLDDDDWTSEYVKNAKKTKKGCLALVNKAWDESLPCAKEVQACFRAGISVYRLRSPEEEIQPYPRQEFSKHYAKMKCLLVPLTGILEEPDRVLMKPAFTSRRLTGTIWLTQVKRF